MNECSDEAATKLVAAIKHKTLEELELSKINLTSAAAEALGQLLPELSALRRLSISSLNECSYEAATKLVAVIKHKTLEKLELSKMNVTSAAAEAPGQLLAVLSPCQGLRSGSLTECSELSPLPRLRISESQTQLVASFKHKNLVQLYLDGINLTSAVPEALGQLLREPSSLQPLEFRGSDGCTLWLSLSTLEIRGLTESSAEGVLSLIEVIKNRTIEKLELSNIDLTSTVAEALGQLLPELSALQTLSIRSLTERSDEAITKLVASIKHKNLDELCLHGINLTSAVAEALGQLLREPSSLQTLQLYGSDGWTLLLNCQAIFVWRIPTQKISGLTESSAEGMLSLIEVIKNRTIKKLELSNIDLTSTVAEALGQLLPKLSSLQTLKISGLTKCSDEAVTRLIGVINHKTLEELERIKINLTSAVIGRSLSYRRNCQPCPSCPSCPSWFNCEQPEPLFPLSAYRQLPLVDPNTCLICSRI